MKQSLVLSLSLVAASAQAQSPVNAVPTAEELGRTLRTLLLPSLPQPLVQQSFDWGRQERAPVGVAWKRDGLLLKPEIMKQMRNDGHWRKIMVSAENPERSLQLGVRDVKMQEPGRLTFGIDLSLPVRIRFEQQIWKAGVRLYSGETRARCIAVLQLDCESTSRLERKPGSLLPDMVFRLRVKAARLNYHDLVVEHTAGVGGDAAKLLGEAVHTAIRQWKPSLERDLLDKANQAIVKASDTRELRVGLSKLFENKK